MLCPGIAYRADGEARSMSRTVAGDTDNTPSQTDR
jgi:hypothetical protein